MRQHRVRGRLVFPAVNSLVRATMEPLPVVKISDGRCDCCRAPGVDYSTTAGRTGWSIRHKATCLIR
jgi:hypothetical protein